MVSNESERPPITAAQQTATAGAQRTQAGLAAAQEHLYRALGRPQPMRERKWAELDKAREAMEAHRLEVQGPEGVYAELRLDAPWLIPRIQQLVSQLARIEAEAADLKAEVERVKQGDLQALPEIRADAERMLGMLRNLLAREADLIYERFNEPVAMD
jgi:hypothetical protein